MDPPPPLDPTNQMIELAQDAINEMEMFDSESLPNSDAVVFESGPRVRPIVNVQSLVNVLRRWYHLSEQAWNNTQRYDSLDSEENFIELANTIGRGETPDGESTEERGSFLWTESPLQFLHRMFDVQQELLHWLTTLTTSEITSERHRATPIEVECIKTISTFHHKLFPIMQHVYACEFQDHKPYNVFVCHTAFDEQSYARPLAERLKERGARVFFDEDTSLGRITPIDEMMWALTTCKVFWCIASPACVQDWYSMRALQVAYARYIWEQENSVNLSLIVDCFATDSHNDQWDHSCGLHWNSLMRREVESLKLYRVQSGTGQCERYPFPQLHPSDEVEESYNQRIERIAAENWWVPSSSHVMRRRARSLVTVLLFVVVAVLVSVTMGKTSPDKTIGHHPSSTSNELGSDESWFNNNPICNEGGLPPSSIFPERPYYLFGRDEEMKKLNEMHSLQSMMAVVGGAGVGKTHLTVHYVNQWFEQDKLHHRLYWLEAASEKQLRSDYIALLQRFGCWPMAGLQGRYTISDLAELLWEQLGLIPSTFEWMVVYNNAPEVLGDKEGPSALEPFFFGPRPLNAWSQGSIVFTTRSRGYNGLTSLGHIKKFELDPLGEDAAISMLLSDTIEDKDKNSTEAAREVVGRLGYLPLAIITANSIMIRKKETVEDYLENMGDDKDVEEVIGVALKDALDYADGVGLGYVLDIVSFINPDQISMSLMQNRTDDVYLLSKLSLLRRVGEGVYSMHRMHQAAAREGRSALNAINAVYNEFQKFDVSKFETWDPSLELVPHAVALEMNTPTEPFLEDLFRPLSRILYTSGSVLYAVQDYERAKLFYEKSVNIQSKLNKDGAENDDVARTLNDLGLLEQQLGNFGEAKSYLMNALEMYRDVHGDDAKSVDIAKILSSLGEVEGRLGDFTKAQSFYMEALKMYQDIYGADGKSVDLAGVLNTVGGLETQLGNYEKARSFLMEAMSMYRDIYGDNGMNVDIAMNLNNLGGLEDKVGNCKMALSHYVEALKMLRDIFGENAESVIIARTLINLGFVEEELGEHEKARSYYLEALQMLRDIHGDDTKTAEISEILDNLGSIEDQLGNHEKAKSYQEEAKAMLHNLHKTE